VITGLDKEHNHESDDTACKREVIVLSEKKVCDESVKSCALYEIHENKFLFTPFGENMEDSSKEEWDNGKG
jgi:hypothetical protein